MRQLSVPNGITEALLTAEARIAGFMLLTEQPVNSLQGLADLIHRSRPLPQTGGAAGTTGDTKMNPTTASTVRALVRLALRERKNRNETPMERPSYWCHHDAFRAYLTSAQIVAKIAKDDARR